LIAGEFILDGCSLLEHCKRATHQEYGKVSPLGWTPADYQRSFVERLLLREPALLLSGRRELLVCPECADLGCGCISAEVSLEGDYFLWNHLGYENNYDPEMTRLFAMGSFAFHRDAFVRQLSAYIPDA
jgi:hypothetical protein